jgi:hypothetical protein
MIGALFLDWRCLIVVAIFRNACLLASTLVPQSSLSLPWTMPGDFLQRLRISDLVVSGTVESVSPRRVQNVDGAKLNARVTRLRVDRVFQGKAEEKLQFTWFTLHMEGSKGFAYAGPSLADFQPRKRYLVFLKRDKTGWTVAMPLYSLEVELSPTPPVDSLRDLTQLLPEQRNEAIGEELEMAAVRVPIPPPGMTGEAAAYFPAIFDLLGGCAAPFYRSYLSSPSPELRAAALSELELIGSRHLTCKTEVSPMK